MRVMVGDVVDDVFSDYGELYIRIWNTLKSIVEPGEVRDVLVQNDIEYPYMADMVYNICHAQFKVIKEEIADIELMKIAGNIFTITREN